MHKAFFITKKRVEIVIILSTKFMGLGINVMQIYDCWEWELRIFCFSISLVFKKEKLKWKNIQTI